MTVPSLREEYHIYCTPYDQTTVDSLRAGGPDAYGYPAERAISDGDGNPCRSCLHDIPKGAGMLICAARPFPSKQPYAETGPIFLCAVACSPWAGHGTDDWIVYGTGQITLAGDIAKTATALLNDASVDYVDVRSARNNCFQTRIRPDL